MTIWNNVKNIVFLGLYGKYTPTPQFITKTFLNVKLYYYVKTDDYKIKVTKEYLEALGVSEAELFKTAYKNTVNNAVITPMENVMRNLGLREEDTTKALVITNKEGNLGAAALICKAILNEACNKLGTDRLFIIPRSIHELIIISRYDISNVSEIVNYIRRTNRTYVDRDEVLSNTGYTFYEEGFVYTIL